MLAAEQQGIAMLCRHGWDSGLDGVIVADTVMSEVDGEAAADRSRGSRSRTSSRRAASRAWRPAMGGFAAGGGDEKAGAGGLGCGARARFC